MTVKAFPGTIGILHGDINRYLTAMAPIAAIGSLMNGGVAAATIGEFSGVATMAVAAQAASVRMRSCMAVATILVVIMIVGVAVTVQAAGAAGSIVG